MSSVTPEQPFTRPTGPEFEARIAAVTGPLAHAVIHTFRDWVPQLEVERATQMARDLGRLPGILGWMVVPTIDERKGRNFLELGIFQDGQALLNFRKNPDHEAFTALQYTDWIITDFPAGALLIPGQHQTGLVVPPTGLNISSTTA